MTTHTAPARDGDFDTTPPTEYWCNAEPFRAHVVELMRATGLHWRLIAAQAHVAPSAMDRLLHERRPDGTRPRTIHVRLARALLHIDEDDLREATTHRTSVVESRELLHALSELGFTHADLSPWLTPQDLQLAHASAKYCTIAAAARIQACYDLLTSPATATSNRDVDLAAG